jgi:hypothetical protein
MSEIKMPEAIHHSRQHQQQDLGETIYLYLSEGAGPGAATMLGTIFNADDFPCEEDVEDVEIGCIAFADKVVRSFNCHDALLAACQALDAFEEHAFNCADCEEIGPGNCKEGGTLWTKAHLLNSAALHKAKPKPEEKTDAIS